MKAVVMEIGSKHTVALTREGEYIRLKTLPHYRVGNEIEYTPPSAAGKWARYAAAAAMLIFCIGLGTLAYAYAMPYSYVNLDINPSVEIAVNLFDYIIRARGLNADGDMLLSCQSVLHRPLGDGVDILLERLDREKYLPPDSPNTLLFTIVSEDQRRIDRFDRAIGEAVSRKLPDQRKAEVYVIHTGMKTRADAKKQNLSSGRYLLIEELKETTGGDLDKAAIRDIPISQIVEMVRENSPQPSPVREGVLRDVRLRGQKEEETRQRPEGGETRQREDSQGRERQNTRQGQERGDGQQKEERTPAPQRREGAWQQERQDTLNRQGSEPVWQRQENEGSRQERQNSRQVEEPGDSRQREEREGAQRSGERQPNRQRQQGTRQQREGQDTPQGNEGGKAQSGRERATTDSSKPKENPKTDRAPAATKRPDRPKEI